MTRLLGLWISFLLMNTVHAQLGIYDGAVLQLSPGQAFTIEQGYAVIEGDIILGKVQTEPGFGVAIPPTVTSRWPDGIVHYQIAPDLPAGNRDALSKAMAYWEANSVIRFIAAPASTGYIEFIPATGTTCSSHVGRTGSRQVIKLATRCGFGNTVHEIGHALGLWHEQSRADRDSYVNIIWNNISSTHQHNFNRHERDGVDLGLYDYGSIMHYSAYAFSTNGQKTIEVLQPGATIGQRAKLSAGDIAAIAAMYGPVSH